ncbi:nitroreductase family protein [Sphingomonas sp. MS122]|uniref:nitroreductase family protein n=1 Tax=Sphingomonas sp. MS122 TaxID=3412683 RepID=UPI003C2BD631
MSRTPDHPIEPLFVDRWSPRSFSGEPIPDAVLHSAFEAARWAPSAYNGQPWRFIVARNGDAAWPLFLGFLTTRNREWAQRASALIAVVSNTLVERRGEIVHNGSHSFDTGAAWANFAHQALLLGWHTHGIGGFDREGARFALAIPEDHAIETIVAIGRQGTLDTLHADFHPQEAPSTRRPLVDFVFEGRFGAPAIPQQRSAA